MEQPVWQPGKAVPAEPLGTGVAIETRPPSPTPAPAPVRTPTPVPPSRRPSVPRPPSRGGGGLPERPPWLVPAAVAIVIVLLLGIVGFVVLSHRGGSGPGPVAQHSPSPHASSTPRSSPSPTGHNPQAVPTYAAATADPVKSVQICTTDSPCSIPGSSPETATNCSLSSCKIEVAIYFTSVQKSTSYSYILKFFDRCTGQTTDLPGPNPATTPSTGYIVAIPSDHWSVSIPGGVKSGALVAVSQAPAIAASPPLLLGADTC